MLDTLAVVALIAARQSVAVAAAGHPLVDQQLTILVFTAIMTVVLACIVRWLLAPVGALLAAAATLLRMATSVVMAAVATTAIVAVLLAAASGIW